jgi:mannan endo-1,4-beta-mannosidase
VKGKALQTLAFAGLIGLLSSLAFAATVKASFVSRTGQRLVLEGKPFRFTGLNIYNANSRGECWYTMASGSALDDALNAIGSGKKVIRAWFFQTLATNAGQRDWSGFDHTLDVARDRGYKVIATLANQWPDCEPVAGYKDASWYGGGYMNPDPGGTVSYRTWATQVAARYKDDPAVLAWQLMNEAEVKPAPVGPCAANAPALLKSFAADVSAAVKSADPNHLISLGTLGSGQCGAQGSEYQDVHDVSTIDLCEYHDYNEASTPIPGDQWNGLQVRLDQCKALGKPVFVGETGIKPSEVGGTLASRAAAFEAKFRAQFSAGVVGELVWAWSNQGSTLADYDVGAGDPVLDVLGRHPVEVDAPASASPLSVALVPAFRQTISASQCTARGGTGSTHGTPLALTSCNPPGYVAGTAAKLGNQSVASAQLVPVLGDLTTAVDEADLSLALSASDVRSIASGGDYVPSAGGPDVTLVVKMRLSDNASGPARADAATVTDFELKAPLDCSVTAGPEGANCAVLTSVDSLTPGSISEGESMVMQSFRVRLNDSGLNGIRGDRDDRNFAQQGIYVP